MTKRTDKQASELSGELVSSPEVEIPFAPGFDLEALKKIDPEPVFATVKISSGKGDQGAGPYYGPDILKSLEQQFNTKRPPGFKGHQAPDRVPWEYREPVTAWVGASYVPRMDGEADLFVKGYVPSTAEDLRTQLLLADSGAEVVNSVSIFGTRKTDQEEVVDFDLWSLDWTPKGRAGMETELVSVSGEQAKEEQMEIDRDSILRSLRVSDVPDHIVGEIRKDERNTVITEQAPLVEAVGEMRIILELDEGVDPAELVDAVRQLVGTKKDADLEARVDTAVAEMEATDLVKAAVRDSILPKVTDSTTDEELSGEITSALELPYIAALVEGKSLPVIHGERKEEVVRKGTSWA